MYQILEDDFKDARETMNSRKDVIEVLAAGIEQAIVRRFHNESNDIAYAELIAGTISHDNGLLLRIQRSDLGLSQMMHVCLKRQDLVEELKRRGIEYKEYEEPDAEPAFFIEYGQ